MTDCVLAYVFQTSVPFVYDLVGAAPLPAIILISGNEVTKTVIFWSEDVTK